MKDLIAKRRLFAKRLNERRKAKCLTFEALAKLMGSTKSYMWELEQKSGCRPSADMVFRLADFLDTTPAYLMGREESTKTREQALLLAAFGKLTGPSSRIIYNVCAILINAFFRRDPPIHEGHSYQPIQHGPFHILSS